jgi:hypothetical protein
VIASRGDRTHALRRRILVAENIPLARHGGTLRINTDIMYAAAPDDVTYCLPNCPSLAAVKAGRVTRFASRRDAEAAGFRPCVTCRPHHHPDLR